MADSAQGRLCKTRLLRASIQLWAIFIARAGFSRLFFRFGQQSLAVQAK
jgi:hypothetical protein